jgi:hypothetical protein
MQMDASSAEYGRSSAIVNMTLKSGTNRLHGDFYEFNRVSNLGANDFSITPKGLPFLTTRRIISAARWAGSFAKTRRSSS